MKSWGQKETLSPATLEVLKQKGFTSLHQVRDLKPEDVMECFEDTSLLLQEKIALRKAVANKPKILHKYDQETFRILLVGKSGSGKSSTGNTIMGKDVFPYGESLQGVTRKCEHRLKTKRSGLTIEITDSPGLFDPEMTGELGKEIVKTVALMDPGPTAVLYVVRFGRHTKEEFDTYNQLKELFGPEITRYITIVFTGGDMLKKGHKTIEQCIKEAGNEFQKVLQQCQSRYVVFNNYDSKKNKKSAVKQLLEKLRQNLRDNGNRAYRCPIQEEVGEELERFVQEKVRQSAKVKEYEKKIRVSKDQTKKYRNDYNKLCQKLDKTKEEHEKHLKEDREMAHQTREGMKQLKDDIDVRFSELHKEMTRLSGLMERRSIETEKLIRQKEEEERKEQAEEMKKTKETISAEKRSVVMERLAPIAAKIPIIHVKSTQVVPQVSD